MRYLKNALSLVLVICMLFSVAVFADDEEILTQTDAVTFSDVDPTTVTGQSIYGLANLKILNGYPDGTFRPDDTITRAEFTVVITNFLNLSNIGVADDVLTGFPDLDNDPTKVWARKYVYLAVTNGIIKGYPELDGTYTFRADNPVTYEEAVKMVVCALGYEPMATQVVYDHWATGYMMVAQQLGILKNALGVAQSAPVSRGIVANIVYSSLTVDRMVPTVLADGSISYVKEKNSSVISDIIKKDEVSGIVTATYLSGIDTDNPGFTQRFIEVDDVRYVLSGSVADYEALLGKKIKAYAQKSDNEDYPVLTNLQEVGNKEKTVNVMLIEEITPSQITYYESIDASRSSTLKLDSNYSVIFNGKYVGDYNIRDIVDDVSCGYVEFLDNDGDGRYEILKITSYDVYVVSSYSTTERKIRDLYYTDKTFTVPDESTVELTIIKNGKKATSLSLARYDVVSIKESPKGTRGRKILEIIVNSQPVSNTVTESRQELGLSIKKIGKEEYIVSRYYENLPEESKVEISVGNTVQVYLDAMGQIVAASANVETANTSYGYLIRAQLNKDTNKLEIQVIKLSGSAQIYQVTDRIRIDGETFNAQNHERALDKLEEAARLANAGLDFEGVKNDTYSQLIRYTTNNAGLVTVIDTVIDDGSTYDKLSRDYPYSGPLTYSSSSKSFEGKFGISTSTTYVFYIPDNRTDIASYSVKKANFFLSSTKYHVEAYNIATSGTKNAEIVLMYGSNASIELNANSPVMLVTERKEELGEDDEPVISLKGYVNGTTTTITSSDYSIVRNVDVGDVIRYTLESGNKIAKLEVLLDVSDNKMNKPVETAEEARKLRTRQINYTEDLANDTPNATFRIIYGTVIEISEDEDEIAVVPALVTDKENVIEDARKNLVNIGIPKTTSSNVTTFIYDSAKEEVIKTADIVSEITPYEPGVDDPTVVFVYSKSGSAKLMYIIR